MPSNSERMSRSTQLCGDVRPPVPFCTFSDLLTAATPGEEPALETCSICYQERPKYVAVGRCGHTEICWHCSVRLRKVLFDTACPLCKEDLPEVVLASSPTEGLRLARAHAEHGALSGAIVDSACGLVYSRERIKADVDRIFSYTCWLDGCSDSCSFSTLEDLKSHLRTEHSRQFCETCLYGRHVFLHEQLLYDPYDLDRHFSEGDNMKVHGLPLPPIPAHVGCNFCHEYFYSTNELMEHMNKRHEMCGICERRGHKNSYYRDAACLSQHYEEQHFVCMHEDCQRDSFHLVAFGTEDALRVHEATKHAANQSSLARSKKQGVRLNLQIGTISYRDERERRREAQQPWQPTVESASSDTIRFMWPRNHLSKLKKGGYSKEWLACGHSEQNQRYPPQPILSPLHVIQSINSDNQSLETIAKPVSAWRGRKKTVANKTRSTAESTQQSNCSDTQYRQEGVRLASPPLLSAALQMIDGNLDAKETLLADEYKARNRQFKVDLEAALGGKQLADFKQHSLVFRQVTTQACSESQREAAVKTYAQQVLAVFSSGCKMLGETRTASLLADLVVLLPDRDLRYSLSMALHSLC